jgi:hypothetical protein
MTRGWRSVSAMIGSPGIFTTALVSITWAEAG